MDFVGFPKIARLLREVIVTEKIDGTNAQICIGPDGEFLTGSRTRWITPEQDNHGFSRWAHEHKDELMALGPGRHFGEWWGNGINRGYGLKQGDKRFSMFNVVRWCLHNQGPQEIPTGDPRVTKMQDVLPPCVGLVPIIWRGQMEHMSLGTIMSDLENHGSYAAISWQGRPEGIVVFHTAANVSFKVTLDGDDHKGNR